MDDKEHACWRALFKDVLSDLRLVALHSIGEFFPLVFAEFEEQKVFADGFFNEFNIRGAFWAIDPFYVFKDLLRGASSIDGFVKYFLSVVRFD